MAVPKIPSYLSVSDWKKNVLPAIKQKWKSETGMTNVSNSLRALNSNLNYSFKNCGHATTANSLRRLLVVLVKYIKKLQVELKKESNNAAAKAILAYTNKMVQDVAKFKKMWNEKYIRSWSLKTMNAYPGLKKNFYLFSKKEFSEENVEFILQAVKTPKDPKAMLKLFDKYVSHSASKQINIVSRLRSNWTQANKVIEMFVKPKSKDVKVGKLQVMEALMFCLS